MMIKGRNIGEDVWKYTNKRSVLYTLLSYVVIPILAVLFMLLYPLKAFINFVIKLFYYQNTHNMKGRIDRDEIQRQGSKNNKSKPVKNSSTSLPSHSLIYIYIFYCLVHLDYWQGKNAEN